MPIYGVRSQPYWVEGVEYTEMYFTSPKEAKLFAEASKKPADTRNAAERVTIYWS